MIGCQSFLLYMYTCNYSISTGLCLHLSIHVCLFVYYMSPGRDTDCASSAWPAGFPGGGAGLSAAR